jgi:hypothetical protein
MRTLRPTALFVAALAVLASPAALNAAPAQRSELPDPTRIALSANALSDWTQTEDAGRRSGRASIRLHLPPSATGIRSKPTSRGRQQTDNSRRS